VYALTEFIGREVFADLLEEPAQTIKVAAPEANEAVPEVDLGDDLSDEELAAQLERRLDSLMNRNSL
jgi:hypothetical protein